MSETTPLPTASLSLADRRVSIWLACLAFVGYAWFWQGGGWNQNVQFALTRAMVEDGTLRIDRFAGVSGDVSYHDGHLYANKAPGLSLAAALPYSLLHWLVQEAEANPAAPMLLSINAYLCSLVTVALSGALIPALLFRMGRRRGVDARWAAIVALMAAFATQLFPYSTMLMAAVPSAALTLVSISLLDRITPMRAFASGLAMALAGACNYLCFPLLLVPALLLLRRSGIGGPFAAFVSGSAIPLLLIGAYHAIAFGSPFRSPISTMDERFVTKGALLGIFRLPDLEAFVGITVSPYRGLLFFSPVLLIALLSIRRAWNSGHRDVVVIVSSVTLYFVLLNSSFNGWEGGFGAGARYLMPAVPLLSLLLGFAPPRLRIAAVVIAVLSFGINFAVTAVDAQVSGSIPRPLTQYVLPLLTRGTFPPSTPLTPPWSNSTFTGHVAVNRVALDEPKPFVRHAPHSDAAEWASFNLGERMLGRGSPWSLLPLALILCGGAWAILRLARDVDQF